MSSSLYSLTHGWGALATAYISVQVPVLLGLIHGRAPASSLIRSPLLAIALMIVCAILWSQLADLLPVRNEWLLFVRGVAVSLVIGYLGGRLAAAKGRSPDAVHRRGAVVSNTLRFLPLRNSRRHPLDSGDRETAITIGGIPVAPEDEAKHFKFVGTTGTGKSTAIREILSVALARGDRAIIADPDGGYLGTFYNAERGDVVLNPFEVDGARWSLIGEVSNDYDVDQLARSLIPDNGEADRSWSDYARTFFASVTQQAIAAHVNDKELYELLTQAPVAHLKVLLNGTPAGPFLEDGNERMFASVRAVTSSAVRAMKYIIRQQSPAFSIRKWVREGAAWHAGGAGGVLFMPYKAGEIAALRSMISAWMRIAIFEAMSHAEGDQRLWFVVDELDALGEIDGLKDALARLRKFGGRTILGFQSIAQVSGTYGRGTADTIVENCGNTLILRCSASEHGGTAEFASKLIGQREITQTTQSRTRENHKLLGRSSSTSTDHIKIEPAVMPSEIERLADLEGFLKCASTPDWCRVKLTPRDYPAAVRPKRDISAGAAQPAEDRMAPVTGVTAPADAIGATKGAYPLSTPAPKPGRPVRKAPGKRKAAAGTRRAKVAPPRNKGNDSDTTRPGAPS